MTIEQTLKEIESSVGMDALRTWRRDGEKEYREKLTDPNFKEPYQDFSDNYVIDRYVETLQTRRRAEPPKACQGNMQLENIHWEGELDD
ncbi:hypothetical protein LCGC14_1705800 [marine sediment metagenome]|uniref:Uncharacterized protein n=1 Tax=marine sediment metagenome TaxID=412755 RepID=A0A0F9I4A4_9ZZZZ